MSIPDATLDATLEASPGAPAELPKTIIRPCRGWHTIDLGELWQYHELLYFLTWRDVKVRYKQTMLGAAWAILQPLMTTVVLTLFRTGGGRVIGRAPLPDVRVRRAPALVLLLQRDRRCRPAASLAANI